jgi:hypothetical protein
MYKIHIQYFIEAGYLRFLFTGVILCSTASSFFLLQGKAVFVAVQKRILEKETFNLIFYCPDQQIHNINIINIFYIVSLRYRNYY